MLRVQETIPLFIESIVWARIMRNTSERWAQIRNVRLDFFNKLADAAYTEGSELPYSMATENLNHEIELVLLLEKMEQTYHSQRLWIMCLGMQSGWI